jgi:D-lyxose ketol-isomerase
MITQAEAVRIRGEAMEFLGKAGIVITPAESGSIETADFGLNDFYNTGLGVLVYVNTDRCCAKEIVMWPGQTCPEHRHPRVGEDPGKEETFRCRWGTVYLYVEGAPSENRSCQPPESREGAYTVFKEVVLRPGDQYTLYPNTLHWFQAGPEGAVVSEFSTRSTDENDYFSDPEIQRITKVV